MVRVGNGLYFLFLFLFVLVTIGIDFLMKKKSEKVKFWVIFFISLSAFCMHFLKLAFEPYRSEFPYSFRKSTFENICAVSTLIFPWIFLSKSQSLKDYMGIIGMISGIAAFFVPTEVIDKSPFTFDGLRFYYAHYCLFITGFMMVKYHLHHLDYKHLYRVGFVYWGVMFVIVANEIVLIRLGFVEGGLEALFDPNIRNSSLIFGISEEMGGLQTFLTILSPKIFRINPITKETCYWPLIWIMLPSMIYILIAGTGIHFLFQREETKKLYCEFGSKAKEWLKKKKA